MSVHTDDGSIVKGPLDEWHRAKFYQYPKSSLEMQNSTKGVERVPPFGLEYALQVQSRPGLDGANLVESEWKTIYVFSLNEAFEAE